MDVGNVSIRYPLSAVSQHPESVGGHSGPSISFTTINTLQGRERGHHPGFWHCPPNTNKITIPDITSKIFWFNAAFNSHGTSVVASSIVARAGSNLPRAHYRRLYGCPTCGSRLKVDSIQPCKAHSRQTQESPKQQETPQPTIT